MQSTESSSRFICASLVGTETDNEPARKLYEWLGGAGVLRVFFTYKL